jgi:hypothetical protein
MRTTGRAGLVVPSARVIGAISRRDGFGFEQLPDARAANNSPAISALRRGWFIWGSSTQQWNEILRLTFDAQYSW